MLCINALYTSYAADTSPQKLGRKLGMLQARLFAAFDHISWKTTKTTSLGATKSRQTRQTRQAGRQAGRFADAPDQNLCDRDLVLIAIWGTAVAKAIWGKIVLQSFFKMVRAVCPYGRLLFCFNVFFERRVAVDTDFEHRGAVEGFSHLTMIFHVFPPTLSCLLLGHVFCSVYVLL